MGIEDPYGEDAIEEQHLTFRVLKKKILDITSDDISPPPTYTARQCKRYGCHFMIVCLMDYSDLVHVDKLVTEFYFWKKKENDYGIYGTTDGGWHRA